MKPLNKFKTAILTAAMVFGLSAGAFAAAPNDSSYIIANEGDYPNNVATNVTIIIESDSKTMPVLYDTFKNKTINAKTSVDKVTVSDALMSLATEYTLTTQNAPNYVTEAFTSTSTFLYNLTKANTTYGPVNYQGGWSFRVNDMIPLEAANWGATTLSTTIKNNDVIHFFQEDTTDQASSTRYTRLTATGNIFNVKESHQWFGPAPTWEWFHPNFTNYAGVTVEFTADGTTTTLITSNDGNVDAGSLSAGTYEVKVPAVFKTNGLMQSTQSNTIIFTK